MKRDVLIPKPEWWKHLRRYNKRVFWHRMRRAYRAAIARALNNP